MGVKLLLEYLERKSQNDDVVDFIQLAKSIPIDQSSNDNKTTSLTLVVDGESCLNRLYGGFYSDWVCGGQWNRMASFIKDLVEKASKAKIEMVVFFNGAIEPQRMDEWISNQKAEYSKMCSILGIIEKTGAQPKFNRLWTPPVGVRSAIRMMLREMNVNVVSTIDDHRQEVIAYCRENNIYGLIADDAEYVAFHPSKLFSAMSLKLRYRGTLESKEFKIREFMTEFDLTNEKLCVLAALLGNYLLPDKELKDVYEKVDVRIEDVLDNRKKMEKNPADDVIPKLAKYVSQLNVSTDLDNVVRQIFGSEDPRAARLKQSIQYYLNGTKEGFLKYRSVSTEKKDNEENGKDEHLHEPDLDTTALASEKSGDKNILNNYDQASACLKTEKDDSTGSEAPSATSEESNDLKAKTSSKEEKNRKAPVLPHVSHEVMRTLSERHSKGLMSPYIYQILSQGEIKLPVLMQYLQKESEIPNIYEFYKPIRQMVYAIVFNLHHHQYSAHKEKKPLEIDIRIKEWVFDKDERIHKPEYVKAAPVGWGVPTIQRLWFGTLQDDKRRRLRAFLTCMRSDVQLILNPDFVPQELLMAAVVLRYIMSFPEKILRKQELDAFIVTALTLEYQQQNPDSLQELNDVITTRNVQLAVLFMKGVEMALLVNDACGAPIPWLMCCPWLFFDGKLFNSLFQKAITCKNLQELCNNRLGVVLRVERMRQAILENLSVQFARPPGIPPVKPFAITNADMKPGSFRNQQIPPPSMNRSGAGDSPRGRRSLGGSMKVAGVVVSSWGANYSMTQPSYDGYVHSPPQVSANNSFNNCGYRSRPAFNPTPRGKSFKFYANKRGNNKFKDRKPAGRGRGRGRGMTVGISSTATDNDLSNGKDVISTTTVTTSNTIVNGEASNSFKIENESNTLNAVDESSSSLAPVPSIGSE